MHSYIIWSSDLTNRAFIPVENVECLRNIQYHSPRSLLYSKMFTIMGFKDFGHRLKINAILALS